MLRKTSLSILFLIIPLIITSQELPKNLLTLKVEEADQKISKEIYGHFAEHLGHGIYEGIYVGKNSDIPNTNGFRNDVLNALKELHVPVIRWPGGCFADTYNWRDGIGPQEKRPSIVNVHWGGVTEDNSFGTHEFLELCELLGAEPYINLNVGTGSVREAAEWVEYVTSDAISPMTDLRKKNGREKPWNVKYWGVGNETWGCGGNMTPEYYTDLFKHYSTFLRGNNLYRIASGSYDVNYNWTEVVMKNTADKSFLIQGLSLHYYTLCGDWSVKGSAVDFDKNDWFTTLGKTLRIDEYISNHSVIMDKYDPAKKVGLILDEWGTWYDVEPGTNPGFLFQQNTLRDALVAGINFNIFNSHADRVKMTNIAQMINVLQSVILTRGPEMVLTPTYHVFEMYKVHQDAKLIPLDIKCGEVSSGATSIPVLNASASIKDGTINITLCNLDPDKPAIVDINLSGKEIAGVNGSVITAEKMNDYNDFGIASKIAAKKFTEFKNMGNVINAALPAKSVVLLQIK